MEKYLSLNELLPGLVVLTPLVAAALTVFKWGISRHDAQFTKRKEFLQHWKDPEGLDDLSVEVLVRQLTGAYLPAAAVRRICRRGSGEVARTLLDLAAIWPLVKWDARTATASWQDFARTSRIRSLKGLLLWFVYFGAGIVGATALITVAFEKPAALTGFIVTAWCVILIAVAGVALWKTDPWGIANKSGEALLCYASGDDTPSEQD